VTDHSSIHLILDKSAVIAYMAGNIAVGEALALLLDEIQPAHFGIHLMTLAEADLVQDDDGVPPPLRTVRLLMAHVAFRPLTLTLDEVEHLLDFSYAFKSAEMGAALASAYQHDAYVLTAHPDRYLRYDDNAELSTDERVIGI
jgi:hypothetical protein